MKLFDTHFHYDGELAPADYLKLVESAALRYLLAVGGGYEESLLAERFAGEVPDSWFAVGVHPHGAEEFDGAMDRFAQFRANPRLAAIGELGLDFYYDHSEHKIQFKVLERFLELALDWNLPAVIHLRDKDDKFDAYAEGHRMLRDFASAGGRGEVHCFSGTPHWAEKFLELGFYLGITGMVTFPKAHNIRETLRVIPLDRLLLETDAPYLAPVPFRGKTNHPGYLVHIAEKVADEKCLHTEELARITTDNAFRFLNLEKPE